MLQLPSRRPASAPGKSFRFIARRDGDHVRVFNRNAKDWTYKVPLMVEAMPALPVTSATIDGEGAVVDERGFAFGRPAV